MFSVVYWPNTEFIHIRCATITIHNMVGEVRGEDTVFQGAGGECFTPDLIQTDSTTYFSIFYQDSRVALYLIRCFGTLPVT